MNRAPEKSDGWDKMEIEKIIKNLKGIIIPETNELKPFPEIVSEELRSISTPRNYPIIPERFISISNPVSYPIVPYYLISISKID